MLIIIIDILILLFGFRTVFLERPVLNSRHSSIFETTEQPSYLLQECYQPAAVSPRWWL